MLNRYPLWKYIMLLMLVIISFLYALPNVFGEHPSIQITSINSKMINNKTVANIKNLLQKENIHFNSILMKSRTILLKFSDVDNQLNAHGKLLKTLDSNYVVALGLIPATPIWLNRILAKPMKLGLDLRGGVHFLMEVDLNTTFDKLQKQKIASLLYEFKENDISLINIKPIDKYGIEINFINEKNCNQAFKYLNMKHRDLLISYTNLRLSVFFSKQYLEKTRDNAIIQNINILRHRVNQLGITEPLVQKQGTDHIIVELPGVQDTARTKEILGSTSTLEFRMVNTNINPNIKNNITDDSEIKYTANGDPIVVYKRVILTGNHIIDSTVNMDDYHQPQVNISLDNEGGRIMSNFTRYNLGELMATLLVEYKSNNKNNLNKYYKFAKKDIVLNIAKIKSYLGRNFYITGIRDIHQARHLSILLKSGTLVAPINIIEERIIGPMMGKQNINQGLKACLCGLIISIIFMITYYKKFGIIAALALIINLMMIIGIMSIIPGATLTMPGIAGIVLSLSVAVDANVLINERIKEELKNGLSIKKSIDEGYKRAFSSIVDANITTIITAIILYYIGTGSIKGFAITTGIGVLTSMFTAIFGTRAIVNFLYERKYCDKLSI